MPGDGAAGQPSSRPTPDRVLRLVPDPCELAVGEADQVDGEEPAG